MHANNVKLTAALQTDWQISILDICGYYWVALEGTGFVLAAEKISHTNPSNPNQLTIY